MRDLYIERYKFKPTQIKVTGYGRTDPLVNQTLDKLEIIEKYAIPAAKKYVLIAPTWKQDAPGRSVLPFGMKEEEFFTAIDTIAQKYDTQVIFRTHLNSGEEMNVSHLKHISFMPYSKYEVVEDFLFLADILVTDWSSIGTDYLPLRRPAIFLDVPAPFRYGFNLGPEHRYGDVVNSLDGLTKSLEHYLARPEDFWALHQKDVEKTIKSAYGNNLDGHSVERYFHNLNRLLGTKAE
jgi:CDP-glycerol glycerophosphotransferase